MNETEQVIEKVNKYLTFMRYTYNTQEQLSRLHVLHDYYSTLAQSPTNEHLMGKIDFAEKLSGELILPLEVRGVFLTEGRPQNKFYTAEALKQSANNPVNASFPLMLDHKDKEAAKIIGMVDKIAYDPVIKGLRWWGHVNDETFARNILDSAITDVSATIWSISEYTADLGLIGTNLTYSELSLVRKGAEKDNYIESY